MLVRHYRDPSWWPAYKGAMWHQLGAMHVFSLQEVIQNTDNVKQVLNHSVQLHRPCFSRFDAAR